MKTHVPTKRELKRDALLNAARTQAFNWSLSVGFDASRNRYHELETIHANLTQEYNGITDPLDPEKMTLHLRLLTIEYQLQGIIDAGERRGWMEAQ